MTNSSIFTTDLPVPPHTSAGAVRTLENIADTGTWWTGQQRVAIMNVAQSAISGTESSSTATISDRVVAMASKVATDAHSVTNDDVLAFTSDGIEIEAYVELIGIVARTVAIDTTARGLGSPFPSVRVPSSAEPVAEIQPDAKQRSAFVPTIGPAGATSALSSVTTEYAAQADLHGALYLTYSEMSDLQIHKGLERWQLELVASRTSLLNHCHY